MKRIKGLFSRNDWLSDILWGLLSLAIVVGVAWAFIGLGMMMA